MDARACRLAQSSRKAKRVESATSQSLVITHPPRRRAWAARARHGFHRTLVVPAHGPQRRGVQRVARHSHGDDWFRRRNRGARGVSRIGRSIEMRIKRPRGFTLVELLVVIGIIAVLISV